MYVDFGLSAEKKQTGLILPMQAHDRKERHLHAGKTHKCIVCKHCQHDGITRPKQHSSCRHSAVISTAKFAVQNNIIPQQHDGSTQMRKLHPGALMPASSVCTGTIVHKLQTTPNITCCNVRVLEHVTHAEAMSKVNIYKALTVGC